MKQRVIFFLAIMVVGVAAYFIGVEASGLLSSLKQHSVGGPPRRVLVCPLFRAEYIQPLQNNYQLAHLGAAVGLDHPVVQAGDDPQAVAADKPPLGMSGGRVAGVLVMVNLSD